MRDRIPTSCADLDLAAVERELIRTGANVTAAARSLGVPTHDLRVLTRVLPRLIEVAMEAEELRLDEARGAFRRASNRYLAQTVGGRELHPANERRGAPTRLGAKRFVA
jgi:hypothetical protein